MKNDIWEKIQEIRSTRKKAVLCIVVQARGSTPRKEGAKLLVTEDGEFIGTVGGGNLEYQVIERAKELLKGGGPQLISFNLKNDLQMACGGQVNVYLEPILPPFQLIIFGGGHVGQALARFTREFDFDTVVVDPRKEVLNSWKLKENIKFVHNDYIQAIESLKLDTRTFVCSMTYGHEYDLQIAARCLKEDLAYLGVLASRNKARKFATALVEDYGYSHEQVAKIDMPMGLDMQCETPDEIAISILAKLIDVKNKLSQ